MVKLKTCAAWALLLVMSSWGASAEDTEGESPPSLTLYAHDFLPYHYQHEGQWQGINANLVKAALTAADIPYTIEEMNWARAQQAIADRPNTGLLTLSRTAEREERYQWVGPLVSRPTVLIGLKQRRLTIDSHDALRQLTIGVLRDGATHEYLMMSGFRSGQELVPLVTVNDTYRMLERGRVDLIPASELTFPFQAKEAGIDPNQLEVVYTLDYQNGQNYLALSKKTPPEWRRRLNEALQQLRQAGQFEREVEVYRLTP